MTSQTLAWILFNLFVLGMLALDLGFPSETTGNSLQRGASLERFLDLSGAHFQSGNLLFPRS